MVLTELQRRLVIAAALRRVEEFTSQKISQLQYEAGRNQVRRGFRPAASPSKVSADGRLIGYGRFCKSSFLISFTLRRAVYAMMPRLYEPILVLTV